MFPLVQHFPLMKQKIKRIRCLYLDQFCSCTNSLQLVNILLFFKHFSLHYFTFDRLCVSQCPSPFFTPRKNDKALKASEDILNSICLIFASAWVQKIKTPPKQLPLCKKNILERVLLQIFYFCIFLTSSYIFSISQLRHVHL